jgi:hypothetical protein
MKCSTVSIEGNSTSVERGIELPYRDTAHGAQAYLGYPFVTKAAEGPQSLGNFCDIIDLDQKLVSEARTADDLNDPHYGHSGRVRFTNCRFDGNIDRIHPDNGEQPQEALVLVRASKTETEFPDSDKQIGTGFLVDYRYARPSRHPCRYEHKRVAECLYRLDKGQRVAFSVIEPAVRVFGVAVHKGVKRTFEITNDGDSITLQEISSTPLNVPDFEREAFNHDLGAAAFCALFFLMAGLVVASPGTLVLGGLIGTAVGLVLFALIELGRVVAARCERPRYTSLVPQLREWSN